MSRFSSYFDTSSQSESVNANNDDSLTVINGSCNLSGVHMSNILLNDNAILGAQLKETIFSKVFVVNGDLNSQHTSFEILKVNGNSKLDSCTISEKGKFSGNAKFINCAINTLDLRSKDFILENSIVDRSISISSIRDKGKLILDNTIAKGSAKFTHGEAEIILKNDASVGKQ